MADYLTNTADMTIVADAIRAKGGTTEPLEFPQGMADAIAAIPAANPENTNIDEVLQKTSLDFVNTTSARVESGRKIGSGWKTITLKKVEFIGANTFAYTNDLTKVDLYKTQEIMYSAFSFCSVLIGFIIRTGGVCALGNANALNGTPIASGTGYIYVPKSLVEQYKSATNWVTYAAQIRAIEDYPDITGG